MKRACAAFSANAHLLSALDVEPEDVIDTAFGPNLPRLAAIKAKYDPANFFRVNYNIKPALTRAGFRLGESGCTQWLGSTPYPLLVETAMPPSSMGQSIRDSLV